jgi:hypothetical protein
MGTAVVQMGDVAAPAVVVTMVAVSISSPLGPIQLSQRPAKAIGPLSLGRTT